MTTSYTLLFKKICVCISICNKGVIKNVCTDKRDEIVFNEWEIWMKEKSYELVFVHRKLKEYRRWF